MGSLRNSFVTLLLCWCFASSALHLTKGDYVITTPRKWPAEEKAQICIFSDKALPDDVVRVSVQKPSQDGLLMEEKALTIPEGKTSLCENLKVPAVSFTSGVLRIEGALGGSTVNHSQTISFAKDLKKTYIQTDKYLYKPSQSVKFRILTVKAPFLSISTFNYSEIWVESPSGSRIHQWLNVDNSKGLIHMEFPLIEEPEEGSYQIKVRTDEGTYSTTFKVEDYVLPRYEVTITPPPYVLGTSPSVTINVCAKYTFGQPVKGKLYVDISNNAWGEYMTTVTKEYEINGCQEAIFTSKELKMNGEQFLSYSLEAKARVIEDGTNVELKAEDVTITIHRSAITFKDISTQQYFKPELPYTGQIQASFPDDSPAAGELMQLCRNVVCKNITTDDEGVLTFTLPAHDKGSVNVRAVNYPRVAASDSWRSIMYDSTFYFHKERYQSPSNSSLIINLDRKTLNCTVGDHITLNVPVMFASSEKTPSTLHFQVISRGQIQHTGKMPLEFHPTNILIDMGHVLGDIKEPETKGLVQGIVSYEMNLPASISPEAKLIVWYVRSDGEVVSDARTVDVTPCLSNKVKLSWSDKKLQPGEKTTLELLAEPHSLCSLGVVDKSVELLSMRNTEFTVKKLLELAKSAEVSPWENRQADDYEYCTRKHPRHEPEIVPPIFGPVPLPAPLPVPIEVMVDLPGPVDIMEDNVPAEPAVVEEKVVTRRKRSIFWRGYFSDEKDALTMFDDSGLYVFSDNSLEHRNCVRMPELALAFGAGTIPPGRPAVFSTASISNHGLEFKNPQDSEKNHGPLGAENSQRSRTYFPETWLWKIVDFKDSGVYSEKHTLPDTVTEWIGRAVCVHPFQGIGISDPASITTFTPFFADLVLPPSIKRGEVLPVRIVVFNYLHESLPIKVTVEESPEYEILSDVGLSLGSGERTSCLVAGDKNTHTVRIRPKVVGDVNISVIATVNDAFPEPCGPEVLLSQTDALIKPIRVEFEGFPKEKTWTKFICSQDIEENSDFLEKWSLETPPDIVPDSGRAWLTAAGDLMGPTIENLGSLVKMPYGCGEQNMLNFAPNIFVMQYLEASNQTTKAIAEKAILFMEKGYKRELNYKHPDGSYSAFGPSDKSGSTWLTAFVVKCFAQARPYIPVDVQELMISTGWLERKQEENGCFASVGTVLHKEMKGGIGEESPGLLSAFVLISLVEAGEPVSSKLVKEALYCLNAFKPSNPYGLAIKAYALALVKSPDAEAAISDLLLAAEETPNSIEWKENEDNKAIAVETGGYAVLALLAADSKKYSVQARKIIKSMSQKRNSQGGFVSTQDTIVALQAMAAYEKAIPSGETDLVVLANIDGIEETFTVNKDNRFLQQRVGIPKVPSTVVLEMEGTGCTLLQAVVRYNVPLPDAKKAFTISVNTSTSFDLSCKTKQIHLCTSYNVPGEKNSNMAIIEVKLVSGYIPEKEDLKRIVGYGTGVLKRYEVDGSLINFYVDQLHSEPVCLKFKILREMEVENPKPGTVRIYDYYQPEYFVEERYVLPSNEECVTKEEPLRFEDEIITVT